MIRQRLGFETVRRYVFGDIGAVYWSYVATSKRRAGMWIALLNGNLVTTGKRVLFRAWIDHRRRLGLPVPKLRRHRPVVSLDHAWWSGFGEGGVDWGIEELHVGKTKFVFRLRIYLTQTRAMPLLRAVMSMIGHRVKAQYKTNPHPHHRISFSRFADVVRLTNDHDRYPLFGQRRVMLARWRRFVGWGAAGGPPVTTANVRRLQIAAEHLNAESGYQLHLKKFPRITAGNGTIIRPASTVSEPKHVRWPTLGDRNYPERLP